MRSALHLLAAAIAIAPVAGLAGDNPLYGRYVFHSGPLNSDADCAGAASSGNEEITITPTEISSDWDGFGPVKFGKTANGATPFVLESVGPDETTKEKGRAILKSGKILVIEYEDGRRDYYCRL